MLCRLTFRSLVAAHAAVLLLLPVVALTSSPPLIRHRLLHQLQDFANASTWLQRTTIQDTRRLQQESEFGESYGRTGRVEGTRRMTVL